MSRPDPRSDAADPVRLGREVLERELAGLAGAAERLGEPFAETVRLLETIRGRTIVTGVGKSGLIGAKIAATLTSTGTPAFFLHPTDAVHGDLGVVTGDDAVVALSRGGRSTELLQLLPYFARLGTPVVALVQDLESPLARAARIAVPLGPLEEACSWDLVPTTSSTVLAALGDALAVTLMRRRGLTREDFAFVHPGGLLGHTVSHRVRDLMHAGDRFPRVGIEATLRQALVEIVDKGLGVTAVIGDGGTLAGLITDGDLKRILLRDEGDPLGLPVHRFMSRHPRLIEPDELVAAAVRLMERRDPGAVTSLVVVEHDLPVGVLHLHDCLRASPASPV